MAMNPEAIFNITSQREFEALALSVFKFQYQHCSVYTDFCNHLKKTPKNITHSSDIPFLPISFFKSEPIIYNNEKASLVFSSSGTTGTKTSQHHVLDLSLGFFLNLYGR